VRPPLAPPTASLPTPPAVLLVAAAIVVRFLPARARDEDDAPAVAVAATVPA